MGELVSFGAHPPPGGLSNALARASKTNPNVEIVGLADIDFLMSDDLGFIYNVRAFHFQS